MIRQWPQLDKWKSRDPSTAASSTPALTPPVEGPGREVPCEHVSTAAFHHAWRGAAKQTATKSLRLSTILKLFWIEICFDDLQPLIQPQSPMSSSGFSASFLQALMFPARPMKAMEFATSASTCIKITTTINLFVVVSLWVLKTVIAIKWDGVRRGYSSPESRSRKRAVLTLQSPCAPHYNTMCRGRFIPHVYRVLQFFE